MSTQISSNVNYVLEQLNRATDDNISMKISYENELIDGNSGVNKGIAVKPPTIEVNGDNEKEASTSWTLVRRIVEGVDVVFRLTVLDIYRS